MRTIQRTIDPAAADVEVRGHPWMEWAATFFALTVLFHNTDHARRGSHSVSLDLFWAGLAAVLVEVGIVVLVFMRHRLSSVAAMGTGFALAVAYIVAHALPERAWLSDPLLTDEAARVSQVAAFLLILSALTLGAVAAMVIRRSGGFEAAASASPGSTRPLVRTLVHPVVAAMVIGNAIVVTVALAGL